MPQLAGVVVPATGSNITTGAVIVVDGGRQYNQ